MYSARVKTCVVGYSIHVFLCFFTPTARELNVLATMQQPSSVVHSKLQYTQHDNTQRNRKKGRYRCLCSSKFWREIATCMHFRCRGATRAISQSYAYACDGRGFHAPDSEGGADSWCARACLQRTIWLPLWVGVHYWGLILDPGSGVAAPLLMHGMFSNSRGWRVGTSESLLVLLEAVR